MPKLEKGGGKMAERYSVTAILSAVDKNFSSVFKAAKSSMDSIPISTKNVNSGIASMNSSISGLVAKAAALASGATVMSGAISRFDTLNKYPVVMKALGYSMNDTTKSAKLLSDGIDGLPTSLDEITSSAQDFAPLTGSATAGAKAAIALNNAFLASGASVSDTSRGVQQYSQMLATGKADLMSWRTLQETMPIALRKTANAFGYTGKSAEQDLYAALKNGSITMDQLNNKFIELNKGQNGFANLAKKNSVGIGTSFANLANAAKKGMANMLTAIDTGLQNAGFPKIATMIDNLKVVINNSFNIINSAITSVIPPIASLVKSFGSLMNNPVFQSLAGGVIAFIAAFKGISVVITAMNALKDTLIIGQVVVGLTGDTQALAFAFSNMAAESKIAAAAQTAFNAVAELNPYALIISGIIAIAASLTIFFTKTKEGRALWSETTSAITAATIKAWSIITKVINDGTKVIMGKWDELIALWQQSVPIIASVFGNIANVIKSATQSITNVWNNLLSLWQQLINIIAPIFNKVSTVIIDAFNDIVTALGGAKGTIISVIGLISKLGIAALGLAGPVGIAASVIISFLSAWAKTGEFNADGITQVFDNLSSSITNFSNYLNQNLPAFITAGTDLITNLINGITNQIPVVTQILTNLIDSFTEVIVNNLPSIVSAGTEILTSLVNAITAALPLLIGAGVQILSTLINGIIQNISQIISAAIQILTALVNGIIAVLPLLISIGVQILIALINAIIQALPQIINAAVQILLALTSAIITVLPLLLNAALQIILALANAIIQNLPQIISAGVQILLALINGIIQILPQLMDAAITLILALVGALIANLPRIIDAGTKLLIALINGIISVLPSLVSAAFKIIITLVSAIIKNLPQLIAAGGKLILALIKGILQLIGEAANAMYKVGKTILDEISKVDLGAAGEAIMNSLLNGLKRAWEGVKSFVGSIAGWIKDHKGPISYDRRLLIPHGQAVMLGFNEGLMKQFSNVQSNVSAMAGQVADSMQISMPAIDTTQMDSSLNRLPSLSSASLSGSVNGSVSLDDNTVTQQNNALLRRIADKNTDIYLDGDRLVGGTYGRYDTSLGERASLNERWS